MRVRLLRRGLIPYAILLASLAVTAATARYVHTTRDSEARHQFAITAEVAHRAILSRLDSYVAMLLGGAGLFAASQEVSREEFKAYVDRLELDARYPGIQGIGFSRFVRVHEHDAVLAAARQHQPGFEFRPSQPTRDFNAIVYLEPQDERNRLAMGFDMASEEIRREAMLRARDTASPITSGRVRLIQELQTAPAQAGFLIYVPVYAGGEVPDTLEGRRERLHGYVYSPFRADDLLGTIMRSELQGIPAIQVFDGPPADDRLLHQTPGLDASRSLFTIERTIEIPGRTWTLVLYGDHPGAAAAITALVALGGVVFSLVLFVVTRGQIVARAEAERTAETLRASEDQLRHANRAKDDFLATISHELRTPLNAIVGWIAMLATRQLPPDMQAHAVEVIARNAAAQTRLVEDLLDMSKVIGGHLTIECRPVEIRSVLDAAVETVRPMANAASLQLEVAFGEHLGRVQADEVRLQQVVTNLLSNAIKFTPAGGRVTLHASCPNGTLVIRVRDTGVGIDPAFMPHLFERFRQEDSSSTRKHAGTGLGLAIVQHLVALHGGTVEASSPGPGQGATFEVRIPAGPQAT